MIYTLHIGASYSICWDFMMLKINTIEFLSTINNFNSSHIVKIMNSPSSKQISDEIKKNTDQTVVIKKHSFDKYKFYDVDKNKKHKYKLIYNTTKKRYGFGGDKYRIIESFIKKFGTISAEEMTTMLKLGLTLKDTYYQNNNLYNLWKSIFENEYGGTIDINLVY